VRRRPSDRETTTRPSVRVAWLAHPVRLLEDGSGPLVVGMASDAVNGASRFKAWQRIAAERGVATPHEASDCA
jgi:hypothetical protein